MKKLKLVLSAGVLLGGSSMIGCSTPNSDGLVQNGVEAQMREKSKFVNACYESEYKGSMKKPKGDIILRMTLNEDGDVKDIQTLENSFNNQRLENCLKYIVKSTRFDRAGVTMETFVDYPFVFKGTGEN